MSGARGKLAAASIVLATHTQSGPGKVMNDTDLLKNKPTKQKTHKNM